MQTATLEETATLIAACGQDVSFLLQAEPGIGKSALLGTLAERLPGHHARYLEAQTLDVGDIQIPRLAENSYRFIPNEQFVSTDGAPLLILLDELGKAVRPVQNALLRLLHERRLGEYRLPEGSIVFATTNLAADGVGDQIAAHARNRLTVVNVRKPTAEEWLAWAATHDIAPEVMAWVHEYPQALASYTDTHAAENPYIFNPRAPQHAFVSPRSLEKASYLLKQRRGLSAEALLAALIGTLGEPAARDLEAYVQIAADLPAWESVLTHPEKSKVPRSVMAQVVFTMAALSRVDAQNLGPWLTYLARLKLEVQALFAASILRSAKKAMVAKNRQFQDLCIKNAWAF